ncbi:hypothetical protein [Devosia rhizoryzae]|uniref:Polymerase n=1 Tax=Devosia rhizoryzae TaxID=2774137 RepID=A0ABX7C3M4_9HYPH|nr:hypothetical protein [Devosia rhizoryzae]QQR38398.1 hypothetical protein JI748_11475 [Devosia rhizoryzae]
MNFASFRSLQRHISWISQSVLFIFLISGVLYLFFPDQHYNPSGWGVLVKYVLYLVLLGFLAIYIATNGIFSIKSILIGLAWVVAVLIGVMAGAELERALLYLIPIAALLAPPSFQARAGRLALPILLLTAVGAVYEYFILGGFARFHPTSYRGVSIFINPNNLGIAATVLTAYVISVYRGPVRWLSLALCATLVMYSGSKTGMAILVALVVLLVAKDNLLRMVVFGLPILAAAAGLVALGIVAVPLASTWDRIRQYTEFLTNVDNVVFPFLDGRGYYADNAFIQIWIELGLPAVAVYAGALTFCSFRERLRSPLWAIFALASLTTNIPYLFPLAYMFWFHVGTLTRQAETALPGGLSARNACAR